MGKYVQYPLSNFYGIRHKCYSRVMVFQLLSAIKIELPICANIVS